MSISLLKNYVFEDPPPHLHPLPDDDAPPPPPSRSLDGPRHRTEAASALTRKKADDGPPPASVDAPHHRTEAAAELAAWTLLGVAAWRGFKGTLADLSGDMMPTPNTRLAFRLVAAAVDDGAFGDLVAMHATESLAQSGASQGQIDAATTAIGQVIASHGFAVRLPLDQCASFASVVRDHHRARRLWEIQQRLARAAGDEAVVLARELIALESGRVDKSLLDAAYSLRFDPLEIPPPDEHCLAIGDCPIGARGNLSGVQGKMKTGKSSFTAAILGAAQRGNIAAKGDTFHISWSGVGTGAIIHLDTEQSKSDWHALVRRSVTRSGLSAPSPRLVSLPLVMFARSERLDILKQCMRREREAQGGIDLVVIDGIADLCTSPNDEAESLELVSKIHALAQEFDCAIFCILHENPASEIGKTRGHLGSELSRKAFANIRLQKDAAGMTHIFGTDMRKREIPLDQAFCFSWCDDAKMHVYRGRASGLKAAERDAVAQSKAREFWQPIFDLAAESAESGTNGTCPSLSPTEAAQIERDIAGTKKLTTEPTMKKRMQRAEIIGVLRKVDASRWAMNPPGQSGQTRDKSEMSHP